MDNIRGAISQSLSLLHVILMLGLQPGGTRSPGFILMLFLAAVIFVSMSSRSWLFPIIARWFFKAQAEREKAEADRAERARLGLAVDLPTTKELELRRKKEKARIDAIEKEKKRRWDEAQAEAKREQQEREEMEKLIAEAEEAERVAMAEAAAAREREAQAELQAAQTRLAALADTSDAGANGTDRSSAVAGDAAGDTSSASSLTGGAAAVDGSPKTSTTGSFLPPIMPSSILAVAAAGGPSAPAPRPITHLPAAVSQMVLQSMVMHRPIEMHAGADESEDEDEESPEKLTLPMQQLQQARAVKLPQIAAAARRPLPDIDLEQNELIRRHFAKAKKSSKVRMTKVVAAKATPTTPAPMTPARSAFPSAAPPNPTPRTKTPHT